MFTKALLSKVLDVPATYVNETRYSFRLNVTVADQQEPGTGVSIALRVPRLFHHLSQKVIA